LASRIYLDFPHAEYAPRFLAVETEMSIAVGCKGVKRIFRVYGKRGGAHWNKIEYLSSHWRNVDSQVRYVPENLGVAWGELIAGLKMIRTVGEE
jgi:hypothetical protein